MLRFSVFFALGALIFYQLPELPGWHWPASLAGVAVLVRRSTRLRPVLALLAGFAWSHAYTLITQPAYLPGDDKVLDLLVTGQIVSLPERSRNPSRFILQARSVEGPGETLQGSWRFRLSWRNAPDLSVGQVWHLPVRLRAAHGYASPGAWDYEGWLYWQGIRYKGYVTKDGAPELLSRGSSCCRLTRLRAAISTAIDGVAASTFARGVMRAITVGDKSGLSPESRKLFRLTGTSHLMAISGLHVGLLAGLGMFAAVWVWRRLPILCARIPALLAGAVAGFLVALAYALLAGMGLPTQRALIMLTIFALGIVLRLAPSTLHALAMAAVAVLAWHPPSVISAGFWLSFGAVLAILATLRWNSDRPVWQRAIMIQLGISMALWPILGAFDMPASGMAPLINLVLVPVFGLVVVPVSLLGAAALLVAPAPASWILAQLAGLLDWIRDVLAFAAELPVPALGPAGMGITETIALLGAVLLLLAPPGVPLRWLAVPLAGFLWLPRAPAIPVGDFDLHLLDVGQGLSTVVETRSHTLLFDTGPEYPSGFSTADAVILPFLIERGRRRVDRLVLSHGDRDHAGGADHLLANLEIGVVQSGEPERVGPGAQPCLAGERWRWDGVEFEFLHPEAGSLRSGNDASCVLRVSNAAGSVLLTGDIGTAVESRLVARMPEKLKSRAVVVPHHGSRSSSSADFVAATAPGYAMYAAGWANRYGFPAAPVADRWRDIGAVSLETASMGTIRLRLHADGRISEPVSYRKANKRFWRHRGGSAEPGHEVSSDD